MQDIRSPLCFWSLLTIFIVKPLNCAKLRFGKISRHLRVHIISYHGHNLCDALSARPNSTSPAFPSPLRSEDFASSWFRKSSRLPRLPPLKKKIYMFQFSVLWILNTNGKWKAYRTIMQNTNETQTVDIAIRRLRKVAPDGMQRAQMLLRVWRIWSCCTIPIK